MASAKETYRAELRTAARQLGERCLYTAAKWYAPPGQPPPQTLNP
jgi:anaphase-promoting complex subunit 8